MLLRGVFVVLMVLVSVWPVGAEELPFWGVQYRMTSSSEGIFVAYKEGNHIEVCNVGTKEKFIVPETEQLFREFIGGVAVGNGTLYVSWNRNNEEIMLSEMELATKTWKPASVVIRECDQGGRCQGGDTNSSYVAVNNNGVLVAGTSDFREKSRYKPFGGSFGAVQTMFPDIAQSEPKEPYVIGVGNKFYGVYTCTCRAGGGLAAKSVGVSEWEGDWKPNPHIMNILGSPGNPVIFANGEDLYVVTTDWCSEADEVCRLSLSHRINGLWTDYTNIFEASMPFTNGAGEISRLIDRDGAPKPAIAVDDKGRMVIGWNFWNSAKEQSYIFTGQIGALEYQLKGSSGAEIAVTYYEDDFYLVYKSDSVTLEKFNFEEGGTPDPTPTPIPMDDNIPQYGIFELALQTNPGWTNPFTQVTVHGEFTQPDGVKYRVKGFYDGDNLFRVRFSPNVMGSWSYRVWSEPGNEALTKSGGFACIEPKENNHGPISRDGKFLYHADGSDYGHLGGTAFGLLWKGPWKAFLNEMINNGVSYFRIGLNITWGRGESSNGFGGCGDDGYVNGCWLNSFMWGFPPYPANHNHDWNLMNTARFQKLDKVMFYLQERGAYAELVLFDSSMKYALGPKETSQGQFYTVNDPRQIPYLQHMIARYDAFSNVTCWELGNELRHNAAAHWSQEWAQARDYVRWLGNYLKDNSNHLVSYDFMWMDTAWGYQPTTMIMNPQYNSKPDVWHALLLPEDWVDIINIHTDRSGEWWWRTADQILFLINKYNKPASADEPHRKGYSHVPATDQDVRRATWLTTMTGSGLYTMHGVSNGDVCRACIELGDLVGMAKHWDFFFDKLKHYNFHPDWNLLTGQSGAYSRAMHKDGVYVYYVQDPNGDFIFKTFQEGKYDFLIMNAATGEFAEQVLEGKEFTQRVVNMPEMVAFLKPHIAPPLPTPTPTATPDAVLPTPTPKRGRPIFGCLGKSNAAGFGENESSPDDYFVSFLSLFFGMFLVFVVYGIKKRIVKTWA